jgi:hypothetical protein
MYLHMYISWRPLFSTMMFITNINPSVAPSISILQYFLVTFSINLEIV